MTGGTQLKHPGHPRRSFSFRDDSCFPMHFGLVQWQSNIKNVWIPAFAGMTGEWRDGFPLSNQGRGQASRERRVSGGYNGRHTIKTPWTRLTGCFSFRDDSCFPMHFGLVRWQSNIKTVWIPASAGMTGEWRDGFPLSNQGRGQASRERRVSGGYGRQTIKTPWTS